MIMQFQQRTWSFDILFVQVNGYTYAEEDESYGNKIDDLLRKLEAAVDKAVAQAQKALDEAKAQLAAYASKYEADADAEMATDEKSWMDQLAALKAQAKEKNIVITDCLGDNEVKLNNEATAHHATMNTCVTGDINDGTKYAQDALDKVKTYYFSSNLYLFQNVYIFFPF